MYVFLYVKSLLRLNFNFNFKKQLCHESLERKNKKNKNKIYIYSFIFIHLPVPCLHHVWTKNSFISLACQEQQVKTYETKICTTTIDTKPYETKHSRPKRPFQK